MGGWSSVEFLGVFLSGAAGFGFGALWYGVLGERWMKAVGRTKQEIQADPSPLPFIIAFVVNPDALCSWVSQSACVEKRLVKVYWIANGIGKVCICTR